MSSVMMAFPLFNLRGVGELGAQCLQGARAL
jgi:hypothetical protein